MIQPHHTEWFLKAVFFIVGVWAAASILFGVKGASISDVMERWGREYPVVPAIWLGASFALFFHWWKF